MARKKRFGARGSRLAARGSRLAAPGSRLPARGLRLELAGSQNSLPLVASVLLPCLQSWLQYLSVKNQVYQFAAFEVGQRVLLGTHMVPIYYFIPLH